MPHYIVSYNDEMTYDPHILEGPEVENWIQFCASLYDEAALHALAKKAGRLEKIGWDDILESLIVLLGERGYKEVRFPHKHVGSTTHFDEESDDEDNELSPEIRTKLVAQTKSYREHSEREMARWRAERKAAGDYLPWERPLEYRVKSGPYAGQLARFGHRLDDRIGLYLIGETEENQISVYLIDQDELEVEKCTIETTSNTTTATASGPSDSA